MEEIIDKGIRGAIVGGVLMLLVYGFTALRKKLSDDTAQQQSSNFDTNKRLRMAALAAAILGLIFVPSEFCSGSKNCGSDEWMFIWDMNEGYGSYRIDWNRMPIQLIFVGLLFWFALLRTQGTTQPDVAGIKSRANVDTNDNDSHLSNSRSNAMSHSRMNEFHRTLHSSSEPLSQASALQECYKLLEANGLTVMQRETLTGGRQLVVQKVGSSEPIGQFSTEDELIAFALREVRSR